MENIKVKAKEDGYKDIYTSDGGVQIHKLINTGNFMNYSLPFDLNGIFLPLQPFFSGLINFISHCSDTDSSQIIDPYPKVGAAMALCFATDQNRVRNIPSLYRYLDILREPRYANKLCAGEWSLLLVIEGAAFGPRKSERVDHEATNTGFRPREIRYALLSAEPDTASEEPKDDSTTKVIKEDLKGFLA